MMQEHVLTKNRAAVKGLSKAYLIKWAMRQRTGDDICQSVLLVLAGAANGQGECRLSVKEIATLTYRSQRAIKYALMKLSGQFIRRVARSRGNHSTAISTTVLIINEQSKHKASKRTDKPMGQCTPCTPPSAHHAPMGQCTPCTPIRYLDTRLTRKERLVLDDRYHLDNQREYLGEEGSEGEELGWWCPPASTLLCDDDGDGDDAVWQAMADDDEVPA